MNPVTHLLASWSLAEASGLDRRDRAIVTWIGVAPDLDGLGLAADAVSRLTGLGNPALYGLYHHFVLHGLFGALLLSAIGIVFAGRRLAVLLWGLAAVHLHLACDLVGSRGPSALDIWPIHYLGPFSDAGTLAWSGQWPLDAWPNIVFTLGLLAFVFARAASVGHSPLDLFNARAHAAFVAAVQGRWRRFRRRS